MNISNILVEYQLTAWEELEVLHIPASLVVAGRNPKQCAVESSSTTTHTIESPPDTSQTFCRSGRETCIAMQYEVFEHFGRAGGTGEG